MIVQAYPRCASTTLRTILRECVNSSRRSHEVGGEVTQGVLKYNQTDTFYAQVSC